MRRSAPAALAVLLVLAGCGNQPEPARQEPSAASPAAAPAATPVAERVDLQRLVADAAARGEHRVVIPPGVHRVPVAPGREPWHLQWEGLKDLAIEGTGATLVLEGRTAGGIRFVRCERVALRGVRIERAAPSCSQGVIESVEPGAAGTADAVTVRIHAGYPADVEDAAVFPHLWFNVIDPASRRWLTHLRADTPPKFTRLAPDRFRVQVEKLASAGVPIAPGQLVAWRGNTPSDVRSSGCAGMVFEDVTIAGGTGFCFHEMGGEGGNTYRRCAVVCAAPPPGASEAPLLASAADGLHSSDTRRGPLIEGCRFERTDDDAVAIHGSYAMVMERTGPRLTVLVVPFASNKQFARAGDRVRLYDVRKVEAGSATVTAVRAAAGFAPAFRPDDHHQVFKVRPDSIYAELTLDAEVAAGPGWLVSNTQAIGSGYVVRGCTFRDTYARGILAKGSDGLIEDNLFEGQARAAVEFNTETGIWSESDYAHDVVVRGNVFRDVSRNRKPGLLRHPGALTILAFHRSGYIAAPGGHRNISIIANRFEDDDGINILVCSARGIEIRDNVFIRPMRHPTTFGSDKKADPRALVFVHEADGVRLSGNTVEAAGEGLGALVKTSPTGAVEGAADGIRRTP